MHTNVVLWVFDLLAATIHVFLHQYLQGVATGLEMIQAQKTKKGQNIWPFSHMSLLSLGNLPLGLPLLRRLTLLNRPKDGVVRIIPGDLVQEMK